MFLENKKSVMRNTILKHHNFVLEIQHRTWIRTQSTLIVDKVDESEEKLCANKGELSTCISMIYQTIIIVLSLCIRILMKLPIYNPH